MVINVHRTHKAYSEVQRQAQSLYCAAGGSLKDVREEQHVGCDDGPDLLRIAYFTRNETLNVVVN